jgi:hypothetical protein
MQKKGDSMKKKEGKKKLTLNKETITNMEDGKLTNVAGGAPTFELRCPTNYTCPDTR